MSGLFRAFSAEILREESFSSILEPEKERKKRIQLKMKWWSRMLLNMLRICIIYFETGKNATDSHTQNRLIDPAGSSRHGQICARSGAASVFGTFALGSWAVVSMFLAGTEWVPPQSSTPRPRSSGHQKHVLDSTSHRGYSPKTCRTGNDKAGSQTGQTSKYYSTMIRQNLQKWIIQFNYSCCLKGQLYFIKLLVMSKTKLDTPVKSDI